MTLLSLLNTESNKSKKVVTTKLARAKHYIQDIIVLHEDKLVLLAFFLVEFIFTILSTVIFSVNQN